MPRLESPPRVASLDPGLARWLQTLQRAVGEIQEAVGVNADVLVTPTVLTTGLVTYYTVRAASTSTPAPKVRITAATISNSSATVRAVDLYIVPAGASATASNRILTSVDIAAEQTYLCPELIGQVMTQGMTLQAIASANSALVLYVSGE